MEMIKTNNLSKKYFTQSSNKKTNNDTFAVNNINLTLKKRDVYGLIGKNGAGKTTLFKLIMGLSKATSGEISIEGSKTERELLLARNNIGFMISANFYSYLNPYQNIEYYRKLKGILDPKETDRVLEIVGLKGVKKPFKAFSLGMKQRLGLANALLGNPDIVILDEPINGLDPEGIQDIRRIISDMNKNLGITFIISSHILSELDLLCNRFGIIDKGKLIEELDYETLHDKATSSLTLEVDDIKKACVVLESGLQISNYKVTGKNSIVIKGYNGEIYRIPELLVKNSIKINKFYQKEMTLEEYFVEVIGGNKHD